MTGSVAVLADSDKVKVVLELGRLEHEEEKVLYQFVIAAITSISVTVLIGVFQGAIKIVDAIKFLFIFFAIAIIIYNLIRARMKEIRIKVRDDIKSLEGT